MKVCMAKVWREKDAGTASLNGVAKVAPVAGMRLKWSQLGWEATPVRKFPFISSEKA